MRGFGLIAGFAGMLVSLTAAADPVASASSAFQADAAHDGSITFSKPFGAPLKKLWSMDFGGQVSYPIVAGNLVIVIANAPVGVEMAALDVNTGKTIWRKLVDGTPENLGYLAYDSGLLFLQTNDGVLRAYNPANGVNQWSTQLPGQLFFNYVPVAANGYVYAAGDEEGVTVYQVDERSGLLQWSQLFDSGGQGLTFGAGKAYFPIPCNILGLAPNGGRPVWNYYTGCTLGLGLVGSYYDGAFYAPGSFSGGGLIFSSATGEPIGSFNGSIPSFAGGLAYQIAGQSIVASTVSSNNIRWHYAPGTNLSLPPITINGDVYTLSDSGDLYINGGAGGRLKQHIHIGLGSVGAQNTAPSSGLGAGQGKLFVPSGSLLVAFGVE